MKGHELMLQLRAALRTLFLVACTLSAVIWLTGCSDRPRRVPVSGQVLVDGQPVTAGFVRVIPIDARPACGSIGPDGRFTLTTFEDSDGCVPGTHKVTVSAFQQTGSGVRWLAPRRYCEPGSSDLIAKIEDPTDSLKIELTWAGADDPKEEVVSDEVGDIDPAKLE
jgi:hypothetical protein